MYSVRSASKFQSSKAHIIITRVAYTNISFPSSRFNHQKYSIIIARVATLLQIDMHVVSTIKSIVLSLQERPCKVLQGEVSFNRQGYYIFIVSFPEERPAAGRTVSIIESSVLSLQIKERFDYVTITVLAIKKLQYSISKTIYIADDISTLFQSSKVQYYYCKPRRYLLISARFNHQKYILLLESSQGNNSGLTIRFQSSKVIFRHCKYERMPIPIQVSSFQPLKAITNTITSTSLLNKLVLTIKNIVSSLQQRKIRD